MQQKNKNSADKKSSNSDATSNDQKGPGENVAAAYEEALSDIDKDPDFSLGNPTDDLDEGETSRLGEDKTDLV